MREKLDARRSKLPAGVLSIIRDYDSHPVSDLIRELEFERYPGHTYAASSLRLKNCRVWAPLARELKKRLKHNCTLMSQTRGVWMPMFCYNARTWTMSFARWRYETLEDLDYLPHWVKEEYRLGVR